MKYKIRLLNVGNIKPTSSSPQVSKVSKWTHIWKWMFYWN